MVVAVGEEQIQEGDREGEQGVAGSLIGEKQVSGHPLDD